MSELIKRFTEISKQVDKVNAKLKEKRFYSMTHGRNHKITEVGVYDGKTKKYAVVDVRAFNANDVLDEMSLMLKNALERQ